MTISSMDLSPAEEVELREYYGSDAGQILPLFSRQPGRPKDYDVIPYDIEFCGDLLRTYSLVKHIETKEERDIRSAGMIVKANAAAGWQVLRKGGQ